MAQISEILEEAWFATIKRSAGAARPQIVNVSKDDESLKQHAADLGRVNSRATYAVVPVMVVGMDGIQMGDRVRVVTEKVRQESTGYVIEIRNGIAKVRYGTGGGTADVPVKNLRVVSRWVRFPDGK